MDSNIETQNNVNKPDSMLSKNLVSFIKNLFSLNNRKDKKRRKKVIFEENDFPDKLEDKLIEEIFKKRDHSITFFSSSYLRQIIFDVCSYFRKQGRTDGKIGQNRNNIIEIANCWANSIKNLIISYYEGQLSHINSQIEVNAELVSNAKKDFNDNDEYLKTMTKRYRKNPRNFNKTLGIIYLIFTILLVFADYPLALKLTQIGFDLDMGTGNFAIRELFSNPWGVFRENWEVFILAFGVALCTVYIKIFYDEFLGNPMERTINQFRDLDDLNYQNDEKRIKRISASRFAFKTSVLILTIGTIFILGIFRFETIDYEKEIKKTNINSMNMQKSYEFTKPELNSNNTTDLLDSSSNSRRLFTRIAFIAITILFPVISGICFSLGMNNLENSHDYNKIVKLTEISKVKLAKVNEEYNKSVKIKQDWETALDWCKRDDFVDQHQNYFVSYYNHGYEKGLIEPLTLTDGNDLFKRVERGRNKMASLKIVQEVYQENNK